MEEEAKYKVVEEEEKGEDCKSAGEVSEKVRERNEGIHSEFGGKGKSGARYLCGE